LRKFVAPIPPMPTAAMRAVSLGGWWPFPPSTRRGTTSGAAAIAAPAFAVVPRNERRVTFGDESFCCSDMGECGLGKRVV
jgi:hypothetical protein